MNDKKNPVSVQNFKLTPTSIISTKRDGGKLTPAQIEYFIKGVTEGEIADYQASALLMAIYINGLNKEETAALTNAMLHSGRIMHFDDDTIIDKHSTGGIGDKTTFILGPIAAAAGVKVPSIAGRGLGHTGGTVDKVEAIPNFQTSVTLDYFKELLLKNGLVLIGQTDDLAPADKKIYALRDVTATVSSIPLITSSIMSKKLAEGAKGIVLDVKFGNGAFMKTSEEALKLAKSLSDNAARFYRHSMVFLTDMNQPLGNTIGNSLEIIESIDTLKNKGPADLTNLCLELAGGMIYLARLSKTHKEGISKAQEMLTSFKALEKFKEMVEAQNGDPKVIDDYDLLPQAPYKYKVTSPKSGYIKSFKTEEIGNMLIELGGGRKTMSDPIDLGVGFNLHKKIGDHVQKGETLITIFAHNHQNDLLKSQSERFINDIIGISMHKVSPIKLINQRITKWS